MERKQNLEIPKPAGEFRLIELEDEVMAEVPGNYLMPKEEELVQLLKMENS
ncbi:hypothetical protein [Neisseria yangbaofengii]|uniref:hypothetical protein n=1 Tax=Neisseria yangbaofengii TaxID=2709396 RepID=UPI0013EBB25A|nr:hypothetical protein [Neisseria yangbaofengii]